MDNLELYSKFREVPKNAQKEIIGGKLKGKTDINPMWRIKKLTEQFGPCGSGWKINVKDMRTLPGANGEVAAFVEIELYVKVNGEWSEPIFGTGGSMLVKKENSSLATNDEAFKMAYTDAISVACKALGMGADIYWDQDRTKYDVSNDDKSPKAVATCPKCGGVVLPAKNAQGRTFSSEEILKTYGMCRECYEAQKKLKEEV